MRLPFGRSQWLREANFHAASDLDKRSVAKDDSWNDVELYLLGRSEEGSRFGKVE